MKRWFYAMSAALLLTAFTSIGHAQNAPTTPDSVDDAISGTMDIVFNTRTNLDQTGKLKPNSPALGAKDEYDLNITVNKFINFTGNIQRQPNLYTVYLGRPKQAAQLYYNSTIAIQNPKNPAQKKTVGKFVGTVPINTDTGAYVFDGGGDSPCRFDIDAVGSQHAFKDVFNGNLIGKAEKKETLAAYTMKRLLPDGQFATFTIKRNDPMKFADLVLARGPSDNYPRTTVNGSLNYDYETGNYFADNIHFAYGLDGQDTTDTITGSIKWVQDPDRKSNGKGHYEFNLRYNEDKNKPPQGEAAAFNKGSDEDAFFAVDNTIPALTGTVEYVDYVNGSAGCADDGSPTESKVTYHLNANRLSKQQVMEFWKLWLCAIGPTNDE